MNSNDNNERLGPPGQQGAPGPLAPRADVGSGPHGSGGAPSRTGYSHIGVIGALPAEVALLEDHLRGGTVKTVAMREFRSGKLGEQPVTVVQSRMGKVAAAVTATTLIQEFKVDAIIFSGVAGGLHEDLDIGDIVVAKDVVHHDLQSNPAEYERGEVPLLGIRELPTDASLAWSAVCGAKQFLESGLTGVVTEEELSDLGIGRPRVHSGRIATGEEFVHGPLKKVVRDRAPEALCVDMEGAAVAQVCYEHGGIPVCIIRAVSDRASGNAPVAFPKFRDALARHYSYEILRRMFDGASTQAVAGGAP